MQTTHKLKADDIVRHIGAVAAGRELEAAEFGMRAGAVPDAVRSGQHVPAADHGARALLLAPDAGFSQLQIDGGQLSCNTSSTLRQSAAE